MINLYETVTASNGYEYTKIGFYRSLVNHRKMTPCCGYWDWSDIIEKNFKIFFEEEWNIRHVVGFMFTLKVLDIWFEMKDHQ